jgi:hypothetical protein
MVGLLTDKQGVPSTNENRAQAPLAASTDHAAAHPRPRRAAARKLAIELGEDQLQRLLAQLNDLGPQRPSEVVLYAGGRRVAELRVSRLRLLA